MKIVDFDDGCLENFYELVSKNVIRIRKEKKILHFFKSNIKRPQKLVMLVI